MPHVTIISGGQTGVDTAAIKAAIALRMPYRGWVPHGFTNEVGIISQDYHVHLRETPSPENAQRTEWNMRDANMVLTILSGSRDKAAGGTKLGVDVAAGAVKPMCFVDLTSGWKAEINKVKVWMEATGDNECSIAVNGPRESEEPGIQVEATRFLIDTFGSSGCPIPSDS